MDLLPPRVQAFLHAHIDRPAKLDLVLFLDAAGSTTPAWIAASSLDVSKREILDLAGELARDGVVRVDGERLALIGQETTVTELAILWSLDRQAVLRSLEHAHG